MGAIASIVYGPSARPAPSSKKPRAIGTVGGPAAPQYLSVLFLCRVSDLIPMHAHAHVQLVALSIDIDIDIYIAIYFRYSAGAVHMYMYCFSFLII